MIEKCPLIYYKLKLGCHIPFDKYDYHYYHMVVRYTCVQSEACK